MKIFKKKTSFRVSYKLNGNRENREVETDSGVNSMDFQEKLKISSDVMRDHQAKNEPVHKQYRYTSHSVERQSSSQINVPARTRIRSAKTRAANIRSRSRGLVEKSLPIKIFGYFFILANSMSLSL